MKHLFNLLAILMICSYSAHCFGQDEVLKYDFTGWCNKNHSLKRVPYGVGYGMMEIHFKNKGKELQCSIRMGEETTKVSFVYKKTSEIKVAIGDSGSDYDLKVAEYWEKDHQKYSHKDVIRLSLDRENLYHYVDMISERYVGNNEYEYKYIEQSPKEFRLIEKKAEEEEEELPAWMN